MSVTLSFAVALAAAAVALDLLVAARGENPPVAPAWTLALPGGCLASAGALMAGRMPRHPIAVILLVFGFGQLLVGLSAGWVNVAATGSPELPLVAAALWLVQRCSGIAMFAVPLVLVLFPDGRLPRRRVWKALALVSLALMAFLALMLVTAPFGQSSHRFGAPDSRVRPWIDFDWGVQLPPGGWLILLRLVVPAMIGALALAAIVVIARSAGADEVRRRQLRWLAWSGSVFSLGFILGVTVLPYDLAQAVLTLTTAAVCWALVASITGSKLGAIDRVIGWSIVYAVLVAAVIVVDLALVMLAGGLADDSTLAIVAMIAVLIVYAPLRERLLGLVNRMVNGRRGDPYGVVSALAQRLERSDEPDDQLSHIARAVRKAFASPYAAVRIERPDGGMLLAEDGVRTDTARTMPLMYRGETIGTLELAAGRRSTRMSSRDERLLADLVRQAAAAVRFDAVSRELQSIREKLVLAREEERRRIRRDLHDGLGPALAAVGLRLDAARNLLGRDPEGAAVLLEAASSELSESIGEIRRVSHDLRPPALDDLGFERALQQLCERLRAELSIERMPAALPPAVEVAAYRVAAEALTNAGRHARAQHLRVELRGDDRQFALEVSDDGIGVPLDTVAGVGIRSMHERTEELGGSVQLLERDGGGTIVRASWPIGGAAVSDPGEHRNG
ncbi:sensor histidine kinase [Ruicaihuangia caeni]|uniref:histidine kinase n=1 Tax=Ruicaihuangia caeni TaxID=3042517 RepID=A0AAW6T7X5_9MICO|nr:sensor histidine kinase [Klugiella sp. YN-L-19]MDI2098831.1 sensor histidine kinase [Klugiella sp. YN-L-19]